jgi:hypothetical protein
MEVRKYSTSYIFDAIKIIFVQRTFATDLFDTKNYNKHISVGFVTKKEII